MLLEGWAIRKATRTLPDDELDQMQRSLQQAREDAKLSRYNSHLASDVSLHEMILQSIPNSLFARLSQLVSDQSIRIRSLVESIASPDKVLEIIGEHLALLEAVQARDPELAHKCLIAHLEAGLVRTLSALEEMGTSDA
jgi:DNA-binding FadR family transcriptional regulator